MPIPSYILPSAPAYTEDSVYALIPTPSTPIYTPDAISFTRGSDATRTASNGLIQRSPWNLFQQSENFSNAVWGKEQLTVSADTTTAPNGTITADSLVENTATAVHRSSYFVNNVVAGNVYTISFYLKNNGRRYFYMNARNAFNAGSTFDLQNGVVSTTGVGTASITNVGDGWYRCAITGTCTTSGSYTTYYQLQNSGVATDVTYTGDGTSGFFIWGAQLVEGSQPLTYFPTTDRLNVPRIDFSQGSCPALLLEPQRTNLALYSEQLSDASWGKIFSSVTANSTTSPDGNTTADTFTADGSNNQHYVVGDTSGTITSGSSCTYTIYAKKNTNNFIQLWISNTFGGMFANFDLNNGVVGTVGIGAGGSNPTSSITSVGNGWYRCSMTFVPTTTGVVGLLVAMTSSASAARGESNTLSTSVFLWGSQLELGSYATTYIPTTTTSVTRLADSFTKSNIFTNGLITAAGGTWFVELRNNVAYLRDSQQFVGIGSTTALTTNSLVINSPGINGRLLLLKCVSGAFTQLWQTTTDIVKFAIKWNGSTADVFVNGTKVVSATSFTPTNMENLCTAGMGTPLFIQSMALFSTPLSDATLITMTT